MTQAMLASSDEDVSVNGIIKLLALTGRNACLPDEGGTLKVGILKARAKLRLAGSDKVGPEV